VKRRIEYDEENQLLYVHLRRGPIVGQHDISETSMVIIDYDADNNIVGVEILLGEFRS
jgi:uncharacterized protein YuzE